MKRKGISILLILLAGTVLLYSSGQKEPETTSTAGVTGVMTYLEGDVFINDLPAEIGDPISSLDTIETGSNSYCEVIFGQSNIFHLDENTLTQINWGESDIQLKKGAIGSVFTKLGKFLNGEKDFTISTPLTVAGVRGTAFFVKVEDDNNTYLCLCQGKLKVDAGDSQLTMESGHHKAYRFTKNGNTVEKESAPLLYHDDAKMDDLAALIDYTVPWDKNAANY